MLTNIDARQLASIYKMHECTLSDYLSPHRDKLNEVATYRTDPKTQRKIKRRCFNSDQLKFIVEIVFKGHTPLGYSFDGNTLIEVKDFV